MRSDSKRLADAPTEAERKDASGGIRVRVRTGSRLHRGRRRRHRGQHARPSRAGLVALAQSSRSAVRLTWSYSEADTRPAARPCPPLHRGTTGVAAVAAPGITSVPALQAAMMSELFCADLMAALLTEYSELHSFAVFAQVGEHPNMTTPPRTAATT